MTPEQQELARRLVETGLATLPDYALGVYQDHRDRSGVRWVRGTGVLLPDLSDPATQGFLRGMLVERIRSVDSGAQLKTVDDPGDVWVFGTNRWGGQLVTIKRAPDLGSALAKALLAVEGE